ncbi:MAG: hypothetical protein ACYS0K_05720 [Planctomycetota bacterium]
MPGIPPSVLLLDERVFTHLGILRVAAVLEQAGHEVEMLDLSGMENYETVVVKLRWQAERDVRAKLDIPFNPSGAHIRFEHSMRQFGARIPSQIVHTTGEAAHASWEAEDDAGSVSQDAARA